MTTIRSTGTWSRSWPVLLVWVSALAVYTVGSWRPVWSADEGATIVVARSDWAEAWRMSMEDAALGAYYLAVKPWVAASGSALWIRLPSLVFAATATALLFWLVRRAVGTTPATVAAGFLVVVPVVSHLAGTARPYALVVLACVLAVTCWWCYLETEGRGWAAALVAALVLVALSHVYALIICVALAVAATTLPRPKVAVRRTLVAEGIALLVLVPWLLHVLVQAKGSPHPHAVTPHNLVALMTHLPAIGGRTTAGVVVGAAVVGLAALGFLLGWRAGGNRRTLAVLGATWLVTPPVLLGLWQVVADRPGLVDRYVYFSIPALALGAGLALGRNGRANAALALAVLLALGVLGLPAQRHTRSADGHRGRQYAALLEVMALPAMEEVPVLIQNAQYRAVIANDPAASRRFPLMVPGHPGRTLNLVHPHGRSVHSRFFAEMVRAHPTILIFDTKVTPRPATGPPVVPGMFTRFQNHLAVYRHPDVLCAFFKDLLGVFSQQAGTLTDVQCEALARSIERVAPGRISCVAPG